MQLVIEKLSGDALARVADELAAAGLSPTRVEHQPAWLAANIHGDEVTGCAFVARLDGKLQGYIPFLHRSRHRHVFRLGEVALFSVHFPVYQAFGELCVGSAPELLDCLLPKLLASEHGVLGITVEETPAECPAWKRLTGDASSRRRVRQTGQGDHVLVELPTSSQDYFSQFSSKSRYNMKRRTRLLADAAGVLEIDCIKRPEQVRPFLQRIEPVVRRTYHFRLLGKDLTPSNQALVTKLEFLATNGWLRGYLLTGGGKPLAYCIGYLNASTYFYENPGYDPDFAEHSPGSELLSRVISDLIDNRVANLVDFGAGEAQYKSFLGTSSFPEVAAVILTGGWRASTILALDTCLRQISRTMVWMLDKLKLKSALKNLIRRRAGGAK